MVWGSPAGHGVAFDPATGETHFLTELPTLLLEAVSASPATAEDLVAQLAGPVELDDKSAERVTVALRHLHHAGLIESDMLRSD